MDVIVKTGQSFDAEFVFASKITIDPDFITVYAKDVKARMPYERGVLKVDVIPYVGGFLRICADDIMVGQTEWVTGVDSYPDGKLVIEYSRNSRLRIEAIKFVLIEERAKDQ